MIFNEIDKIKGIPPKLVPKFTKLVGNRYADVLLHIPASAIDKRKVFPVADAPVGARCTLKVRIVNHRAPRPRSRAPWKIDTTDGTGELTLLFFNTSSWIEKKYPVGTELWVSGQIEGLLTEKQIVQPELTDGTTPLKEVAKLWPVYPLTAGITQNMLYKATTSCLETLSKETAKDWLSPALLEHKKWPHYKEAIHKAHNPEDIMDLDHQSPARQRLSFDELLAWQLALLQARQLCKKEPGFQHIAKYDLFNKLQQSLPFTLTADQQKAIQEIHTDMCLEEPMLRLVQGDVGAGKTLVGLSAMLLAIDNGSQAAMMAPTEILAIQHYEGAKKLLEPLGLRCALLKGKMKAKEKRETLEALANGDIDIIFGTHALIQDKVSFNRLTLVVIDEQHRFGVEQRLALTSKGLHPDVLVMTATPIPRTLSLTAYGDMDTSLVKEKPPGRTPITTTVMTQEKIDSIAGSIERIIAKNEQVYWVCPLVEESETADLTAATERFEYLNNMYPNQVALLHGKMKPTEKDAVMTAFKEGEYRILVSTTVIEVGVDVPQSTTMIIEHAERFGLAQLHQLRGRVGRGALKSYCILLYTAPLSHMGKERLDIMRQTEDGFLIAEKDLELRGPGETLGTQQSGHVTTRIADIMEDRELILEARQYAKEILSNPLTAEQKQSLEFLLQLFNKQDAARLLHSG